MIMYRQIDVWSRITAKRVARYRCFELLPSSKYCVHSKDFFTVPLTQEALQVMERQFLQLLAELPPEARGGVFDTLAEAIATHDRDFADMITLDHETE